MKQSKKNAILAHDLGRMQNLKTFSMPAPNTFISVWVLIAKVAFFGERK